jgi:hypothetical protein
VRKENKGMRQNGFVKLRAEWLANNSYFDIEELLNNVGDGYELYPITPD